MIEVTKKIICTFILLGSFVFSQCDQYNNETQCSLNSSSCYWESDLTNYNCTQFNSSSACSQYADYGCSWEFSWGGWTNYESSCVGGGFQVDNGICQEVEMPECSEMEETECNTNSNCNWTEDIDYASCSSLSGDECINTDGCDWEWVCIEMGWWYNWCYTYGYECNGGNYLIDNSYCEESEDTFDQCSDLETMPYCNHSSLYDLDCMWVDGECIDYEEPQLECSEMNQSECDEDDLCDWVLGSIDCESFSSSISCSSNNCDWNVYITYGNCWELTVNECYNYPNQCYVDSEPGWYDSSAPYCTGGTYQVNNSFCSGESSSCEEIVYLLGDYNSDGTINVIDVTQVISLIINANPYDVRVDMNSDGIINISDIIVIVNIILNT